MFYFIIKLAAAGYVLSRLWKFLFGDWVRRVWIKIFSHKNLRTIPTPDDDSIAAILGRTNHIILKEPRRAEPKPMGSDDLEPTGFIGEEQPVTEEDIEPLEPPHIPAEEEIALRIQISQLGLMHPCDPRNLQCRYSSGIIKKMPRRRRLPTPKTPPARV